MTFRVEISAQAESDAEDILEWLISQHAGETGIQWFIALEDAIASLATFPERCSLAPESVRFPFEVRQLLYGRKPRVSDSLHYRGTDRERPSHSPRSPQAYPRRMSCSWY